MNKWIFAESFIEIRPISTDIASREIVNENEKKNSNKKMPSLPTLGGSIKTLLVVLIMLYIELLSSGMVEL